jgi:hypothetical protein
LIGTGPFARLDPCLTSPTSTESRIRGGRIIYLTVINNHITRLIQGLWEDFHAGCSAWHGVEKRALASDVRRPQLSVSCDIPHFQPGEDLPHCTETYPMVLRPLSVRHPARGLLSPCTHTPQRATGRSNHYNCSPSSPSAFKGPPPSDEPRCQHCQIWIVIYNALKRELVAGGQGMRSIGLA